MEMSESDGASQRKLAAETISWAAEAPNTAGLRSLIPVPENRPVE